MRLIPAAFKTPHLNSSPGNSPPRSVPEPARACPPRPRCRDRRLATPGAWIPPTLPALALAARRSRRARGRSGGGMRDSFLGRRGTPKRRGRYFQPKTVIDARASHSAVSLACESRAACACGHLAGVAPHKSLADGVAVVGQGAKLLPGHHAGSSDGHLRQALAAWRSSGGALLARLLSALRLLHAARAPRS